MHVDSLAEYFQDFRENPVDIKKSAPYTHTATPCRCCWCAQDMVAVSNMLFSWRCACVCGIDRLNATALPGSPCLSQACFTINSTPCRQIFYHFDSQSNLRCKPDKYNLQSIRIGGVLLNGDRQMHYWSAVPHVTARITLLIAACTCLLLLTYLLPVLYSTVVTWVLV